MGLVDRIKGELLDIVQWLDDSGDTLVYRFERFNNEIKHHARLVVREGQVAVLVSEGKLADVFKPGTYVLETSNLPILATMQGWKYGFESPIKAEVYFCSTRQFTNLKWGTPSPCTMRDSEFGAVRVTAFGLYSVKIKDPTRFIREVVGTDGIFSINSIEDNLRGKIGTQIKTVLTESGIPVLDLESKVTQLGKMLKHKIIPDFEQLGLDLTELQIQDIGLPEEIEKAIDKAGAIKIIGDMRTFAEYEAANSIQDAANNPNGLAAAGAGIGMGLGFGGQLAGTMTGIVRNVSANPVPPPLSSVEVVYYVVHEGKQTGPFDIHYMRQMLNSGQLARDTLVWKKGLSSWIAAGELRELDCLFESVPPLIPINN